MIPVRLGMRNFLCYGEGVEPLDFTGIQVACLSGDNGAGKSAILDAMTWALWGKARTRSDDDLVHTGRTDMEVEFEFRVGEAQYRVIRKRHRSGSGRTSQTGLELHMLSGSDYRAITENTVRETERKIVDILRMDYDTFVHSAFLMQGRADQFTTSAPDKRKQILGSILDLDRYDKMAEAAKERARALDSDWRTLRAEVDMLDRSLAGREAAEAEQREAEAMLAQASEEVEAYGELAGALQRDQQALALHITQRNDLQAKIRQLQSEIAGREAKLAEQRRTIALLEKTIAEKETIERGYCEWQRACDEERRFGGVLVKLRPLEERQARLQSTIGLAKAKAEAEEATLAEELRQCVEDAEAVMTLAERGREIEVAFAGVTAVEARLSELREQEQKARLEAVALANESNALRSKVAELERKLSELSGSDEKCPLCGNDLGEHGMENLQEHYREEIASGRKQASEDAERARKLQAEAAAYKKDAEAIAAKAQAERQKLERDAATIALRISEAQGAEQRAVQIEGRLAEVRQCLASGSYARGEAEELATVQVAIAELAYDGVAHQAARTMVERLKGYEDRHRQLEQAEQQLGYQREIMGVAQAEIERYACQCEEFSTQLIEMEGRIAEYPPDIEARLTKTLAALRLAQEQQQRSQLLLGAAKQKLDTLRTQAHERQEKVRKLTQVSNEKTTYDELAIAFGRSGLQAMLIENALPELTEEANQILGRMTNNRMSVTIDTQREKRTGSGLIETLDIKISDELGTRNYELYSGGEAFRVNFALRVALSKLLARRKGAPLPTLIVDEGFGTQDAVGRERLIEAIQSVQDDFECILVMTHIAELRDAFPVRIECTKTPVGSVATVLHE